MIKILSPIDKINEVEQLIESGADEFFCGVLMGDDCYSSARMTSRDKENIKNIDDLVVLAGKIKEREKNLFLAINRQLLKKEDIKKIKNSIDYLTEIGVDGFIVSNVDLLNAIKEKRIKLIASSFFEAKNTETVDFLKRFNIRRIILDRQITEADINIIRKKFPDLEIEVFIMEAGCRSLDSYCNREIINKKKGAESHTCLADFNVHDNDNVISQNQAKVISERLKLPYPTCGICALPVFKKYHIDSVKIVGRGISSERKIRNVKFVKSAVNILHDHTIRDKQKAFKDLYIKMFGFNCHEKYCYFPHLKQ
ncbi:MAG: U32 family peptidase [Candidatus Gastranaerophilaceae bacterium]